jgi:hypothetical protein
MKSISVYLLLSSLLFCPGLFGAEYRVNGNIGSDDRCEVEEILERTGERFLSTFQLDGNFRLDVYVCSDLEEFLKLTGASWWNGGHFRNRTIYLQRLPVLRERGILERTIIHEFLHYCIWRVTGKGCPLWLHEGLVLNLSGEVPLLDCASQEESYPIEELDSVIRGKNREKAQEAYCQASAIVRKLLEKYGIERLLRDRTLWI